MTESVATLSDAVLSEGKRRQIYGFGGRYSGVELINPETGSLITGPEWFRNQSGNFAPPVSIAMYDPSTGLFMLQPGIRISVKSKPKPDQPAAAGKYATPATAQPDYDIVQYHPETHGLFCLHPGTGRAVPLTSTAAYDPVENTIVLLGWPNMPSSNASTLLPFAPLPGGARLPTCCLAGSSGIVPGAEVIDPFSNIKCPVLAVTIDPTSGEPFPIGGVMSCPITFKPTPIVYGAATSHTAPADKGPLPVVGVSMDSFGQVFPLSGLGENGTPLTPMSNQEDIWNGRNGIMTMAVPGPAGTLQPVISGIEGEQSFAEIMAWQTYVDAAQATAMALGEGKKALLTSSDVVVALGNIAETIAHCGLARGNSTSNITGSQRSALNSLAATAAGLRRTER